MDRLLAVYNELAKSDQNPWFLSFHIHLISNAQFLNWWVAFDNFTSYFRCWLFAMLCQHPYRCFTHKVGWYWSHYGPLSSLDTAKCWNLYSNISRSCLAYSTQYLRVTVFPPAGRLRSLNILNTVIIKPILADAIRAAGAVWGGGDPQFMQLQK